MYICISVLTLILTHCNYLNMTDEVVPVKVTVVVPGPSYFLHFGPWFVITLGCHTSIVLLLVIIYS